MRRILHLITVFLICTSSAFAADRYWVSAGSSNFNDPANWSATSGGPGGASVPGANDVAIFQQNFNSFVVNITGTVTLQAIDVVDFAGIITFNGTALNLTGTTTNPPNSRFALRMNDGFLVAQAGTVTVQNSTSLTDATLSVALGATLVVGGDVTVGTGANFIGQNGSTVTFSKAVNGPNNVVVNNAGNTISLFNVNLNHTAGGNTTTDIGNGDILEIRGLLTIQNGHFQGPNATIRLLGNFIGQAGWTTSNIGLTFAGGNNQTFQIVDVADRANWTGAQIAINKTGGEITLLTPWIIGNAGQNITFGTGLVNTTTTNFLQFNEGTTWSGASNASYVNGPVRKSGTSAFTFPVGNRGFLGAIHMSGNTAFTDPLIAARTYQATYTRQNPLDLWPNTNQPPTFGNPPQLVTISTCEYWLLDEQDNIVPPSSSDPTIPFAWLSYDNVRSCGVSDATFIGVMGWLGSARWNNFANGGLTTVNGINFVRANTRTFNVLENIQAPAFTLGTVRPDLNPLPVRWLSFNGRYFNSGVDLSWSTAAELNNDKFTVERSADGVSFTAIGEVRGRGNSNVTASYSFRDNKPMNGVSYYRIRQTDLDGKESYSEVIKITITNANAGGFRVFPNPLNGNAPLVLENTAWTNKKVTVTVFNALGAIVRQEQVTFGADSRARLDLSNLQGGSYFIRTQFNNQKEVLPFVIQ